MAGEGREILQWLRALVALEENSDSVATIPMVAHKHLDLQFQEVRSPLLASVGTAYM